MLLPSQHAPATVPAPLPASSPSAAPLPAPLCFIHAKQPETIQAATAAPQLDNATPHQLLPHTSPFPSPLCGRLNDASPVSALHEAEAPILLPLGNFSQLAFNCNGHPSRNLPCSECICSFPPSPSPLPVSLSLSLLHFLSLCLQSGLSIFCVFHCCSQCGQCTRCYCCCCCARFMRPAL